MIEREISSFVRELISSYPIVTIIGPRQSGKTTLAKHLFPEYGYVSMEDPDVRDEARADMRGFLLRHSSPMIFDEIQRVPELASYLQTIVDKEDKAGMYVLTGSHQAILRETVSQSLAGRVGLVDLLPLSIRELKSVGYEKSRDEWIFDGFMPRLAKVKSLNSTQLYRDYFRTYIERDARQLINIQQYESFEKFVKLLAGRIGQVLNLTSLANETGVSATTIKMWIKVLEASYIIFTLKPYYKNYGKRLIKAPKIYFTETGLVRYLLGITNARQIAQHPLAGNLFENMVVCEILKSRLNAGKSPNIYYFRDSQGFEVDVIVEDGGNLKPIEIKSSHTFHADFVKGIEKFKNICPDSSEGMVVYAGKDLPSPFKTPLINFQNISEIKWE